MMPDLQKGGSRDDRTYRLMKSAIDAAEETAGLLGGAVSDEEMLALALIERGTRYDRPGDIEKSQRISHERRRVQWLVFYTYIILQVWTLPH